MDRRQVTATTYQQRNFYVQMRDGFFSRNETFNYVLHHQVAHWAAAEAAGGHVLDVCCGRGLMLPLLRYHAPKIASYTGLDIKPGNAVWRKQRVTDGKPIDPDDYYPFATSFVEGNVAQADQLLAGQQYQLVIYTASIEHMNPADGLASLGALRKLVAPGALLILTCPNTPEGQDGYDTRYRAHVYEWKLAELRDALESTGWRVQDTWGCDLRVRDLEQAAEQAGLGNELRRLRRFVPQEWLVPALAPLLVEQASEVGLLCRPNEGQLTF